MEKKKNAWEKYPEGTKRQDVFTFAEEYRKFISSCKTGRIGGNPVRVLKNRMSREYVRQEKAGADKMALERFTLGSLRKAVFDGDTENGSLMAGQAAGLLHEVRPVEEIFAAMVSEAKTCITGLYKETI